ncbi:hypothetical protein OAN83_02905 [Alphaproteobacteria bacterium]|nr:hypothetical protein [Alphaproteobacteria bacterium]
MDIRQLKQRIDVSGKKLVTLSNEYIKSKDEIAARKVLVRIFAEISQQTFLRQLIWLAFFNCCLIWIKKAHQR